MGDELADGVRPGYWRMKHVRSRLKHGVQILIALVGVLALGLFYIAYGYWPPESQLQSAYLAELATKGLDHYCEAGDYRWHYLKTGVGPPVILIPGGGAWIYDMRHLADALSTAHTVYVLDMPGNGYTKPLSDHPDYDALYRLETIDQSLLSLMDSLALGKADLIGNSWGGGYALYFAETHPERVGRLISLAGSGLDLPDSALWETLKWPVIGEALIKLTASPGFVRQNLQDMFRHKAVTDEDVREYYVPYSFRANLMSQWILERNLDWKTTERLLPALKAPHLYVWGRQDNVLDPGTPARWRRLLTHAQVEEIDDAGHLVHQDQPGKVAELVLAFLK